MSRLLLLAPWAILMALSMFPAFQSNPIEEPPRDEPLASTEELVYPDLPTEQDNADRRARRDQFTDWQQNLLLELFQDQLTLTAFVDRVLLHCLSHYPEYLESIHQIEPGRNLREKIARNTLRVYEDPTSFQHLPRFAAMRSELEAATQAIADRP